MKNHPRLIRKARSERPYLKKLDLPTSSLMSRRNSRRRMKGQRTLIEEVVSSIDTKAKKKTIKLTLNCCETTFYWKTPVIDQVPHSSRRRQGQPEERGPIDEGGEVPAARVFLRGGGYPIEHAFYLLGMMVSGVIYSLLSWSY
jgi:hypothetical protein